MIACCTTSRGQTMASGMALEVDHKRGSAWVRGRPDAVDEGRREFQNKLASLFPGDFLAVSCCCCISSKRTVSAENVQNWPTKCF